MFKFLVNIVFLCLAAAVHSQIITPGQCDGSVPVVQDFDVKAYTGVWYEVYRYEQIFQFGDCVTATYTLFANETGVDVLNRMVLWEKDVSINGYAVIDSSAPAGEGKLLVTFPSVGRTSPYWVLSTNYNSYSLVYSCGNISSGTKATSAWILSRSTELKSEDREEINKLVEEIDGLNWDSFRATKHTEEACYVKL